MNKEIEGEIRRKERQAQSVEIAPHKHPLNSLMYGGSWSTKK